MSNLLLQPTDMCLSTGNLQPQKDSNHYGGVDNFYVDETHREASSARYVRDLCVAFYPALHCSRKSG